jgi:Fe2+ transport system protein FeoA
MTISCAWCGRDYEPGGSACSESACPLATSSCRRHHCPHCGYETPDETGSVLARGIRWLFRPRPAPPGASGTLLGMASGTLATIEGIDGTPGLQTRLTAQGLGPGTRIRLLQRTPSFVVRAGETTMALERGVAAEIRVRPGAATDLG